MPNLSKYDKLLDLTDNIVGNITHAWRKNYLVISDPETDDALIESIEEYLDFIYEEQKNA